jgi:hypothetical protein
MESTEEPSIYGLPKQVWPLTPLGVAPPLPVNNSFYPTVAPVDSPTVQPVARVPLNIYGASTGATPKISAWNGTFGGNAYYAVGDEIPRMGGTKINVIPIPTLTVAVGNVLVYLEIDVNANGLITGSDYRATSAVDPPANTLVKLYVRIASIVVTVVASKASVRVTAPQNLSGSQVYELCGGNDHLYRLI